MDVVCHTDDVVLCPDADKAYIPLLGCIILTAYFYSAVWPCVQTSASSSSHTVLKKTAARAKRKINAATSELLTKVGGTLILMTLDMGAI